MDLSAAALVNCHSRQPRTLVEVRHLVPFRPLFAPGVLLPVAKPTLHPSSDITLFLGFHFSKQVAEDSLLHRVPSPSHLVRIVQNTAKDVIPNSIRSFPVRCFPAGYRFSWESRSYTSELSLTGTADLLVHHIHAFTIHVTALILVKGVPAPHSSSRIPPSRKLFERSRQLPSAGPRVLVDKLRSSAG